MARRRKSGCGIWLLFWIIIFLVILLILLQDKTPFKNIKLAKKINKIKNSIIKKDIDTKEIKKNHQVELYFIKHIEKSDQLVLTKVYRTLKPTNTPLKNTLNLLLLGPNQKEEKKGISSVFWANTKLKSAYIKGDIAYLDFNSEIETGVGISMLQARLYQVVYTATQFPEVQRVKILINGKEQKTFSAEGLSISRPLKRLNKQPGF